MSKYFTHLCQVRNEFYKDTQGAMLVYDVTNRASFEALNGWLKEMKAHLENPSEIDSIFFVVCANKVSLCTVQWVPPVWTLYSVVSL